MKYIYLLCILLGVAGCRSNDLEIGGNAGGFNVATITVKNAERTLDAVNVKDGKFQFPTNFLQQSGYYTLEFAEQSVMPRIFEIYLDPGKYTINFDKSKPDNYPRITSSSTIQGQLTAFYGIVDSLSNASNLLIADLKKQYDQSATFWTDGTTKIADKIHEEENKLAKAKRAALAMFVDRHPDNRIAAHVMLGMNYESNPAEFYKVYSKLSDEQKNTSEGKEIGETLKAEMKLAPGAIAPPLAGTTPDGKTIDVKALNKKLILIEFWRAGSYSARENHQLMLARPFTGMGQALQVISVSFDKKRDWWLTSIKDDKLNWLQVSDLKGNESPNVRNWGISDIPTYYLLDGQGRIVERNLPFGNIEFSISNYLAHH